MADLMTRIGADDSEFQRKIDNVNGRITSLGRAASTVSKIMKGVGVVGVANFAVGIITQLDEIRERAVATSSALSEIGASAIKSFKTQAAEFRGDETKGPRAIRDQAYEKIKQAEETANSQMLELEKKSMLGKAALEIYNRAIGADEVTVDAMIAKIKADKERTIREINGAANDAVAAWADKARRERGQQIKDSQNSLDKDWTGKMERESQNRIQLGEKLADKQIESVRESGRARDAAMMEQAEKSRRLRDEITRSDYLSEAEKRSALDALAASDAPERAAIDRRFASLYASQAGSVNGAVGVGGATFVQQLGLMNRPLVDHAKEIASNTKETANALSKLSSKLSAGGTYN